VNCREFVDFMLDYVNDGLPGEQRAVFTAHMDDCPSCLTYLDTYRDTVRLGRCLCEDPEGPAPADAPERLIAAILAARRSG
jgi:anti-sigma factor RsiW